MESPGDTVWCAVLSSDRSRLYIGMDSGDIAIYDFPNRKKIQQVSGHPESVRDLTLLPCSKSLFSACMDPFIRKWDISDDGCKPLLKLPLPTEGVRSVRANEAGDKIVCGTDEGSVWLINVETGDASRVIGQRARVERVLFHGNLLISGSFDGSVVISDLCNGKENFALKQGIESFVFDLALNCDASLLACKHDSGLVLYSWPSMKIVRVLKDEWGYRVAFHPSDPDILAFGGKGCTVKVYRVSNGECLRIIQGNRFCSNVLFFDPEGSHHLVSDILDNRLTLWNCSDLI